MLKPVTAHVWAAALLCASMVVIVCTTISHEHSPSALTCFVRIQKTATTSLESIMWSGWQSQGCEEMMKDMYCDE